MLINIFHDLRYALRALLKHRTFTVAALLTLALRRSTCLDILCATLRAIEDFAGDQIGESCGSRALYRPARRAHRHRGTGNITRCRRKYCVFRILSNAWGLDPAWSIHRSARLYRGLDRRPRSCVNRLLHPSETRHEGRSVGCATQRELMIRVHLRKSAYTDLRGWIRITSKAIG